MPRAARPKLAATILLARGARGAEQVLMGLRSKRHDFMPDIYVYPGGRVERADSYAKASDDLNARTAHILTAAMPPARARACVMAAIRETFEETGFIIGEPAAASSMPNKKTSSTQSQGQSQTQHQSWRKFYAHNHMPDLSRIEVIGRAITPPYRPKRFDTWFFLCRLSESEGARPFADSEELLNTCWVDVHAADTALQMHPITQMMLGAATQFLTPDVTPSTIPYSRFERGHFKLDAFPPAKTK